jgi:hypothetical protein
MKLKASVELTKKIVYIGEVEFEVDPNDLPSDYNPDIPVEENECLKDFIAKKQEEGTDCFLDLVDEKGDLILPYAYDDFEVSLDNLTEVKDDAARKKAEDIANALEKDIFNRKCNEG